MVPLRRGWSVLGVGALPFGVLLLALFFREASGPYWLGTNTDPDYVYLTNSLLVAEGHAPVHVDHPGTPVQMLGAAALRGVHLACGKASLAEDVVADPEFHLRALNWVLLLLYAAVLAAGGLWLLQLTGRWLPALLFQLTPLLNKRSLECLPHVKPEPLLLALGAAYAVAAYTCARDDAPVRRGRWAAVLGVLAGLAFATKLTFLPYLLLPLFVLSSWRERAWCGGGALAGFLAGTLPIYDRYRDVFGFLKDTAAHTGEYGAGEAGLPVAGEYLDHLRWLAGKEQLWAALGALCLALLAAAWVRRRGLAPGTARAARALAGFTLCQVLQWLAVAKQPNARYLAPALSMMGVQLLLAGEVACAVFPALTRRRTAWALGAVAAVILVFQGLTLERERRRLAAVQAAKIAEGAEIQARFGEAKLILGLTASAPPAACLLGSQGVFGRYGALFERRFTGQVFYDIYTRRFVTFRGELSDQEALAGPRPCVLWCSGRLRLPQHRPRAGVVAEEVYAGQQELAWRLTWKP